MRVGDHFVGRQRQERLERIGLDQLQEQRRRLGVAMFRDRLRCQALVDLAQFVVQHVSNFLNTRSRFARRRQRLFRIRRRR
jgi:hypothetical protein